MIKKGVGLYGIRPEMVLCHGEAKEVFNNNSIKCIITSGLDGYHSKGTLHVGFALDYRTKHVEDSTLRLSRVEKLVKLVSELKIALPVCDVLLEDIGGKQEHIHIEFDPKDDSDFQRDKELYKKRGGWPTNG